MEGQCPTCFWPLIDGSCLNCRSRAFLGVRRCRDCRQPVEKHKQLCTDCRKAAENAWHRKPNGGRRRYPRASTTERGYGAAHQKVRKVWRQRIDAGECPPCGYCGRPILPGQFWDLGHPNDDRSQIPVPWHRSENRRFGGSQTQRRRRKEKQRQR